MGVAGRGWTLGVVRTPLLVWELVGGLLVSRGAVPEGEKSRVGSITLRDVRNAFPAPKLLGKTATL